MWLGIIKAAFEILGAAFLSWWNKRGSKNQPQEIADAPVTRTELENELEKDNF